MGVKKSRKKRVKHTHTDIHWFDSLRLYIVTIGDYITKYSTVIENVSPKTQNYKQSNH